MILVELTAAINEAGTPRTFYVGTHGFVTSGADTPANQAFLPVIKDAGSISASIFSSGATSGSSSFEPGRLRLVNVNGQFDDWIDYSFEGRPVVIRSGEGGAYPGDFPILFTGTVAEVEASVQAIEITLRDKAYVLDQPVLTVQYAGTNVGPVGLEGDPENVKGSLKPRLYGGTVFNLSPPCVNTSKLAFQVSDRSISSLAVFDAGVALTPGADHADTTSLIAATVASGTFQTCLAEGYFRLGATPVGEVTANAAAGASDADRSVAQILKALATDAGGVTINPDAVSLLDFATRRPDESSRPIGLYLSDDTTFRDAMDTVAASVGAWWAFDSLGVLQMGQFAPPVVGISAGDVIEAEVLKGFERQIADGAAVPAWRVTVRYRKNLTPQTSGLATSVTAARRAELAQEWRSVSAEDASIKVKDPQAREIVIESLLNEQADAQAEAERQLAIHKVRRSLFVVPVVISVFNAARATLAGQVKLFHERFGLGAGRDLVVLGYDLDYGKQQRVTLSLWG